MALKIGEMLLNAGVITQEQLDEALEMQRTNGSKVGVNLIQLGHVKEELGVVLEGLLDAGYALASLDLPGFGESVSFTFEEIIVEGKEVGTASDTYRDLKS